MDTTNQILDQPFDGQNTEQFVRVNLASGGQRFANYIIDRVVCYILVAVWGTLIPNLDLSLDSNFIFGIYLLPILLVFGYYIFMEAIFGKTVGKFVTGTRVVRKDGSAPDIMSVLGRTLCRIIPFEAFSFLGAKSIGWHDSIPGTRVIRDR